MGIIITYNFFLVLTTKDVFPYKSIKININLLNTFIAVGWKNYVLGMLIKEKRRIQQLPDLTPRRLVRRNTILVIQQLLRTPENNIAKRPSITKS